VVDEQVAYMIMDILSDINGRSALWGRGWATTYGSYSPHVKYALKTGTTENGRGSAKDSWAMATSPVLATAIWNGNHDGRALSSGNHNVAFKISANYIERIHTEVYGKDGKWKSGDKIKEPEGMQHMTVNGKNDIWPKWYNKSKSSGISSEKVIFDSVSKKRATDCTPQETRIEVEISKVIDPMTKKEIKYAGGYDIENEDDVHKCDDAKPSASVNVTDNGDGTWKVTASFSNGRYALKSYTISVNGSAAKSGDISSSGTITYDTNEKPNKASASVTDSAGYTASASWGD
jgi:penicillin-binding protein 1A